MSKITSWDGIQFTKYVYPDTPEWAHKKADGGVPVRVVLWPEGAPDPSTVPHVNERCQRREGSTCGEVRSTPYIGRDDEVFIQVMWDGDFI